MLLLLRVTVAADFVARYLAKAATLLAADFSRELPRLHIATDESRVCKRNLLQSYVTAQGKLMALPPMRVPELCDRDENFDAAARNKFLADRAPEAFHSFALKGEQREKEKMPPKPHGDATRKLFAALQHQLNVVVGFNFSFCIPPHRLRPLREGEVRLKVPGTNQAYLLHQGSGQGLKTVRDDA
jgi:hypothetical protein